MTVGYTHVHCRAMIHDECYNGQSRKKWREDGTYDRATDSIVCDPCYLRAMSMTPSGRGLNEELDAAIDYWRQVQRGG